MRITPLDRLGMQEDLADTRLSSRPCYACIPLIVKEAFDVDTQSGNDITLGNGLGQEDAQWTIYTLMVQYKSVDSAQMTFGHVPPGVELGDFIVSINSRDLPAMQQVIKNDDAYLLIDGNTYHAISLIPTGTGNIEEWIVDARKFSPRFRANGY